MKRIDFLAKLHKERKLELIDPNEEIQKSYLGKSESNLTSSKILLKAEKPEESVTLTYYSMYHALTALLFRAGIKCENHSASIILLEQVFNQDNKKITFAKKERIDKQYYIDFQIGLEDAKDLIKTAEEFNAQIINFIETLTEEQVQKIRTKLFYGLLII